MEQLGLLHLALFDIALAITVVSREDFECLLDTLFLAFMYVFLV
jgi:hypothetical protein